LILSKAIIILYKTIFILQWKDWNDNNKCRYTACDNSASSAPNTWLRSGVIKVIEPARIDVTVRYGALKCTSRIPYCKESLALYVHKTSNVYDGSRQNRVPEPGSMPEEYENFASTNPKILVSSDITKPDNNETYSFSTNSSALYYYLAIQYRGGCFSLYNVTISYSVCPSVALPSSLIQLPRTMAPVSGSIKGFGACPANAEPLANNVTLYGECNANGEWSSNVTSGECWCSEGYGKYLNGSGGQCKGEINESILICMKGKMF